MQKIEKEHKQSTTNILGVQMRITSLKSSIASQISMSSMTSSQKLEVEIKNELALSELIEETQEERKQRRETLRVRSRAQTSKIELPSSLDVRLLKGNIYPKVKDETVISPKISLKIFGDYKSLFTRLRLANNKIKSYTKIFYSKSNFLLHLASHLLNNFTRKLEFKYMELCSITELMKPFVAILQGSSNFKPQVNQRENIIWSQESLVFSADSELDQLISNTIENIGNNKRSYQVRRRAKPSSVSLEDKLEFQKLEQERKLELERELSHEEELIDNRKLHKENRAKQKDLCELYHQILKKHYQVMLRVYNLLNLLKEVIGSLEKQEIFKKLIEEVCYTSSQFTTEFSNLYDKVGLDPVYYPKLITKEQNLTILEFKFCSLVKKFRTILDKRILHFFYKAVTQLDELFMRHKVFLQANFGDLNQRAEALFFGWKKAEFEQLILAEFLEALFSGDSRAELAMMVSPMYKRIMRKNLNMRPEHRLLNEDVQDFFRYYGIRYNSISLLLCCYTFCSRYDSASNCCIDSIVCVDVSLVNWVGGRLGA